MANLHLVALRLFTVILVLLCINETAPSSFLAKLLIGSTWTLIAFRYPFSVLCFIAVMWTGGSTFSGIVGCALHPGQAECGRPLPTAEHLQTHLRHADAGDLT